MRFKKFIYSVLLILFILVLVADLGLWFLVQEAVAAEETDSTSFTAPEGMTLPEGMSFPEGMTFPTDGTMPDGVTPPEGGSFPSGGFPTDGTFPGGDSSNGSGFPGGMGFPGSGGRSDRPDRPGRTSSEGETKSAETETETTWFTPVKAWFSQVRSWLSARVTELQAYLPLSELTPIKEMVAPYRLYILIGSLLGMALCIVRLAFIRKKLRQQQEAAPLSHRRVALWPAFMLFLGALVLVMLLFPVNGAEEARDGAVTNARVLTGTVAEKTLTSLIQSAGSLAEQEAMSLTIPASINVSSVCVRNGDAVTAGQIVAKADLTSVMQAIASVHEVLADIDGQLQNAHEAKADTSLTAPVAGTVKVVYAEVGEKAMDVMADHGALLLLSLDGRMAVQIPAADGLTMGVAVIVTLADGSELSGEVSFLEEGVATVTVVDRGYAIGEQVSVKGEDGQLLGSGSLYVHKALNVTGYLGTISRIYRTEGSTVYANQPLIGLTDTADLAEYNELLRQRSEYEAELKTLFELYETGYIHAPCDGVVAGLSQELTYQSLSDMVTGLTARHVSTGPADAEPTEFVQYVGQVLENVGGLLSLSIGADPVAVSDYGAMPSLPAATMTGTYTIPGSSPIYLFGSGWNQITAGDILPGDMVLFTFDQSGSLMWVIVAHTAASATPTPTPSPTPAPTPAPTPDGSASPGGSARPGESAQPEGSASPGGGGRPSGGGGGSFSFGGKSGSAASTPKPTYVIAKQELCTVTPQEKMLITVPMDELDVLSLSLGQEAELYLDALPTMGLTATVTEIDPEGENSGGNTKYTLTLALDRTEQLYPGMNGTVCFLRSHGRTVPTVPLAALGEDGNRTFVYTAYDEETDQLLAPVEVWTGLSDGTDVEILSGLSLGDTYCYRYADSISYVTE